MKAKSSEPGCFSITGCAAGGNIPAQENSMAVVGLPGTPALQHSSPPCSPPLLPVLSAPFPSCTCTPGWSCGSPCSVQVNRGHQCPGTFPEPHHAWCEEQILHQGSGDSQVSPGATLVPVLLYKPSTGVGGHQPPQGCPAMTDPRLWFSQG